MHIEEVIEKIAVGYIDKLLKENNCNISKIKKIGIAAPGTIKNDIIVKAENLGIYDFKIKKMIEKYYKNPEISLNNDAKCAGMCEKEYGSLKESKDAIFLCLGTGIGGAVFLDGKLLKSKKYTGFELGHVTIEKNGNRCACGKRGCFEAYCSMRVLKEKIMKRIKEQEASPDQIKSILKHEYNTVEDIINEFIDNLSIGIGNFIDIFEPEKITIGGSFAYYKEELLPKLIDKLNKEKLTFNNDIPKISTAVYGNDAGIIGATLL